MRTRRRSFRFVKEQLNAMHFALQHEQFATLAQLAGSVKQTADASGHGEFHAGGDAHLKSWPSGKR